MQFEMRLQSVIKQLELYTRVANINIDLHKNLL